jgi:prefoldin subunit 5
VYAKEQERDEAIDTLTERIDNMQGILARLESMLNRNNAYEGN